MLGWLRSLTDYGGYSLDITYDGSDPEAVIIRVHQLPGMTDFGREAKTEAQECPQNYQPHHQGLTAAKPGSK